MSTIAATGSLAAPSKKLNICMYLSMLCSVAIIVLMFLPWLTLTDTKTGITESVSLVPGLLIECFEAHQLKTTGALDALIFLIPVILGIALVNVMYIVNCIREMINPEKPAYFPGTVSLLLVGLGMILFFFATDVAYKLITITANETYTDDFLIFIGYDKWTWVPVTWLVIALVQKLILARFAHKKKASEW